MLQSFPLIGAVLITPALGVILHQFSVSAQSAQWTVVAYLMGYALGQIPYGWLSYRIGYHNTIKTGLGLFIVSCLVCAVSKIFWVLMIGRLLMAFGAAVGLMMGLTYIGNFFTMQEGRRLLGFTNLALGLAPGIGNLAGGLLAGYVGWQSCFYCLLLYACFVWLCASRLPNGKPLQSMRVVNEYRSAFETPSFLWSCFLGAMTTVVIYIFVTTAPLAAVYVLKVAPQIYGLLSLLPLVGTVLGSLFAAYLAPRLNEMKTMRLGLIIMALGVLLQCSLMMLGGLSIWSLFVPMPLIYFGMPLIYTNAIIISLNLCRDKTVASSIFCLFNVGLSLLGVMLVGSFEGTLHNLSWVFVAITGLMWLMFILARRAQRSAQSAREF